MTIDTLPFRRSALACGVALLCATAPAVAATINVAGACTLINAINNANADADTDGADGCPAGSGADVINLGKNKTYTLSSVNNDTDGPNSLPSVTSVITISGNGSTIQRDLASNYQFRIFHVAASGTLTLNSTRVKNGAIRWLGNGGGIFNQGTVTLSNSAISANSGSSGGGIANQGAITLSNSTVSANSSYSGGGIANQGTATLLNSVISANSSSFGGGIANQGTVTLLNSAISSNTSTHYGYGGGIANDGTLRMRNSTIKGNSAHPSIECSYSSPFCSGGGGLGGGIYNRGSLIITNSSIVGNWNTAVHHCFYYYDPRCFFFGGWGGGIHNTGEITVSSSTLSNNSAVYGGGGIDNGGVVRLTNSSISNNTGGSISNGSKMILVHSTVAANSAGINNAGKLVIANSLIANNKNGPDCSSASGAILQLSGANFIADGSCGAPLSGNPKLGPLADNGGRTKTHALLPGSPAVDAADPSLCSASDQRAIERPHPSDGQCDIGAFEQMLTIPQSTEAVVEFFDAEVLAGGIVGTGSGSTEIHKRNAFRSQLLVAGDYKDRQFPGPACGQLSRTLSRIDADNAPDADDYVTGSAAGALADNIAALHAAWVCP